MKVVHTISGLGRGGAEHMLLRLIAATPAVDHIVMSLSGPGALGSAIAEAGAQVRDLSVTLNGRLGAIRGLRRVVRSERPDILQGWMNHGNIAASIAAGALYRRRLIWNVRQSLADLKYETMGTRALIRLQAAISAQPATIVYNSLRGAIEHEAIGFNGRKRLVIPNGFDTEAIRPDHQLRTRWRDVLGIEQDEIAIGFVARFHPWKNHAGFVAAISALLSEYPSLRIIFAGAGATLDNPEFKALITESGIEPASLFLGDRADITDILPAMDLVCSASHGEGFPNAVGEAMAAGLPCVVTPVGASADLVQETGLVARSAASTDLRDALAGALRLGQPGLRRLGEVARARIVEHFSIDAVSRSYMKLYEQVAATAPTNHRFER